MRRVVRLFLTFLVVAAAAVMFAQQASAHAVVVGSTPADGSRLAKSPTSVTIRFDESVGLDVGYLRVVDSAGRRVDNGTATHPNGDGTSVAVPLKTGLPDGSYLASFRVTSADSHPVAGSIRYVVGNGALGAVGGGPSGSAPVNQAVSTTLAVSHWLSFAGIGVVGGSWLIFSLWTAGQRRRGIRRLIWTGWGVGVLGAVGEFLLQGPYSAGTGLGSAFKGELLDATLHINSGELLSLRLVLMGILGAVLTGLFAEDRTRRPSWAPEAAAIVGVGIIVTFAASGHSQSANPRWLAVLVDALHMTAMIIWLGGLAVLAVAAVTRARRADADYEDEYEDSEELEFARAEYESAESAGEYADYPDDYSDDGHDTDELAAGMPIFSRIAMACVATLAVTGTIQAWREIGSLDAITATRYGQLVILKVVLFLGLVTLGYFARRTLQNPADGRTTLARLRRTLLTEVSVGAIVLAATGVLIAQPPGSVALAADRGKARSTTVAVTTSSHAVVQVDPGVHGNVEINVSVSGAKPTDVTATASLPNKQLGPLPVALKAVGPGSYSASGVLLPSAGSWQITITVQTSQFDSTTAVATLKVY